MLAAISCISLSKTLEFCTLKKTFHFQILALSLIIIPHLKIGTICLLSYKGGRVFVDLILSKTLYQ